MALVPNCCPVEEYDFLAVGSPGTGAFFIASAFFNGSSELVSESAAGICTFCFNFLMLRMVGSTGVAAVNIILNLHYFVISIFIGYIMEENDNRINDSKELDEILRNVARAIIFHLDVDVQKDIGDNTLATWLAMMQTEIFFHFYPNTKIEELI